jgi:Flp pilus assembly secretin CpaC
LTTLLGQPASLLVGGRQALPQPDSLGQTGVRFVNVGTQLNFLAVADQGQINLQIALDLSFLGEHGESERPSRQVTITVKLNDGQSAVIAQDSTTGFSVTVTPHLLGDKEVTLDVSVTNPVRADER